MRRLVVVCVALAAVVIAAELTGGASPDPRTSPLNRARGMDPATISMFQGRMKAVPELVERARLRELSSSVPGDYQGLEGLEQAIAPLRNPAARTPAGLWRISMIYPAVRWMNDADFAYANKKFADWKARGGGAIAPTVYRATILERDVDRLYEAALPDADPAMLAAEFQRRSELLDRYLEDNKATGSADPVWFEVALRARSRDCTDEARAAQLLDEASRRFPGYYQHYEAAMQRALACSSEREEAEAAIARIADIAVERSRDVDGQSMYARVYWAASRMLGVPDPKSIGIDWDRMRIGIRDLMQRYPDAWNTNNLAKLACAAKDDELARDLLAKSLELPVLQVWDTEDVFKQCWSRVNAMAKK